MAPPRYRSILLDVYAAFVRDLGGWLAVSDLVTLARPLGLDDQAVRSSVSRFSRKGLLERLVRDGQVGYALTAEAMAILAEGDVRIFDKLAPANLEDGWVLATFSVPEHLRAERHRLRTRLTWLGFGKLGGGVWIAPRRVLARTVEMVAELGLEGYLDLFTAHYHAFDQPERLVRRCWDLDRLEVVYRDYVARFGPVRDLWRHSDPAADPAGAFVDYVQALHEWRKTPYLDPGLPTSLLPAAWPGTTAADVFAGLRDALEDPARRHVGIHVGPRRQ